MARMGKKEHPEAANDNPVRLDPRTRDMLENDITRQVNALKAITENRTDLPPRQVAENIRYDTAQMRKDMRQRQKQAGAQ